ncbi:MAG TPA: hypothetical protein VIG40_03485 [Tissierellaceae bacterium]
MRWKKLNLNNKGYILLEFIIYICLSSVIMLTGYRLINSYFNSCKKINKSLERVEENLTDVLTIRNIILKSEKVDYKFYKISFNDKYKLILNLEYDQNELDDLSHTNILRLDENNDEFLFKKRLGKFDNTDYTSVIIKNEDLKKIYINNTYEQINLKRLLDISTLDIEVKNE